MGCGRVGSSLARNLERVGHSVSIIDQNPAAFRRLGPEFAGDQVTGVGFSRDTLHRAGIDRAGAFAAVSSGDNSNIISARVARETFGVAHVVARIYDPKRAEVYERLGIPTVATVPWTVNRFLSVLLGDKHVEDWRDPSGAVSLVQVPLHAMPRTGQGDCAKSQSRRISHELLFVPRYVVFSHRSSLDGDAYPAGHAGIRCQRPERY